MDVLGHNDNEFWVNLLLAKSLKSQFIKRTQVKQTIVLAGFY